jgi:CO/xanthine dehydrogenase FAD-binding subunit
MSARTSIYLRPHALAEALQALTSSPMRILAGGTDFYAARTGQPIAEPLLNITAVPELRDIRDEGTQWRIGATVTWSDIVRADLPAQFHGLQAAAREVGGVQVQNTATVAGSICNASPAADGIPALIALDAQLELTSLSGKRIVPLTKFVLGSRKIARQSDELVTAILIPSRNHARSSFLKLGHRRYLVISIAMVAVVLDTDAQGVITYAGIAVGSCSAVAKPLRTLEAKLLGEKSSAGLSALADEDDLAVLTLVKRAIGNVVHEYDI